MTRARDKANSTLTSGSEGDQCSALSLPLPSDILPDAKDEKPTVVHIVQPPGGRLREQSGERWRVDLERRKEELTVQKLLPLSPVSSYLYLQLPLGTLHLDVMRRAIAYLVVCFQSTHLFHCFKRGPFHSQSQNRATDWMDTTSTLLST